MHPIKRSVDRDNLGTSAYAQKADNHSYYEKYGIVIGTDASVHGV